MAGSSETIEYYEPLSGSILTVPKAQEKTLREGGCAVGPEAARAAYDAQGPGSSVKAALFAITKGATFNTVNPLITAAGLQPLAEGLAKAHPYITGASEITGGVVPFGAVTAITGGLGGGFLAQAAARVATGAVGAGVETAVQASQTNTPVTAEQFLQSVGVGATMAVFAEGVGYSLHKAIPAAQRSVNRMLGRAVESGYYARGEPIPVPRDPAAAAAPAAKPTYPQPKVSWGPRNQARAESGRGADFNPPQTGGPNWRYYEPPIGSPWPRPTPNPEWRGYPMPEGTPGAPIYSEPGIPPRPPSAPFDPSAPFEPSAPPMPAGPDAGLLGAGPPPEPFPESPSQPPLESPPESAPQGTADMGLLSEPPRPIAPEGEPPPADLAGDLAGDPAGELTDEPVAGEPPAYEESPLSKRKPGHDTLERKMAFWKAWDEREGTHYAESKNIEDMPMPEEFKNWDTAPRPTDKAANKNFKRYWKVRQGIANGEHVPKKGEWHPDWHLTPEGQEFHSNKEMRQAMERDAEFDPAKRSLAGDIPEPAAPGLEPAAPGPETPEQAQDRLDNAALEKYYADNPAAPGVPPSQAQPSAPIDERAMVEGGLGRGERFETGRPPEPVAPEPYKERGPPQPKEGAREGRIPSEKEMYAKYMEEKARVPKDSLHPEDLKKLRETFPQFVKAEKNRIKADKLYAEWFDAKRAQTALSIPPAEPLGAHIPEPGPLPPPPMEPPRRQYGPGDWPDRPRPGAPTLDAEFTNAQPEEPPQMLRDAPYERTGKVRPLHGLRAFLKGSKAVTSGGSAFGYLANMNPLGKAGVAASQAARLGMMAIDGLDKVGLTLLNNQEAINRFLDTVLTPVMRRSGGVARALLNTKAPSKINNFIFGSDDPDGAYEAATTALPRLTSGPGSLEAYYNKTYGPLIGGHRTLYSNVVAQGTTAMQYLQSQIPLDPRPPSVIPSRYDPPRSTKIDFLHKLNAINDPISALEQPTMAGVAAIQAVYPETLRQLRRDLVTELSQRRTPLSPLQAKQVSMLLGGPVDGSVAPEYLMTLQMAAVGQQAPPQQPSGPAGKPGPKPKKMTLNKNAANMTAPGSQQNEVENSQ